jgi:small subunit ribosomal protein S17
MHASPDSLGHGSPGHGAAASAQDAERGTRRTLRGTVVSDRMAKTITVRVERVFKHAKYGKYIRRHKQYHVHDEERAAHVGDEVEILECRPMSKLKRWRLISVVRKAEMLDGGVA